MKNFTLVSCWITFTFNPHAVRLNLVHMRFTPHEVTLNRTWENETSTSNGQNSIVLILTSMYFGFLDAYLYTYCFDNSKEFFVIGSFQISVKVIKHCLILNDHFGLVNKNLQATGLTTIQCESKFSFVNRENKQYY